jgi:hypothetical protein
MKKLHLDGLAVESFTTSPSATALRGTVGAREMAMRTLSNCPESWDGTCYITCGSCVSFEEICA